MDLIKKIYKHSVIAIIPVVLLSAFIEWKFIEWKHMTLGIIAGGVLGFANIKGLAWGIGGLLGSHKSTAMMVFFSLFRLVLLLIIISLLVYFKLANIFGILVGFTVVFIALMIEGLKYSRDLPDS